MRVAKAIELDKHTEQELRVLAKGRRVEARLQQRSRVILLAAHGMQNNDIASLGSLLTEARNPASEHLDELSTLDMLRVINDEDATVAAAVRAELPSIAKAVDEIAARFTRGGRLFYIGAGTSGRLGVLDASE